MDKAKEEIKYEDMNDNIDKKKTIAFTSEIVEKNEASDKVEKNKDIDKNIDIGKKNVISVENKQSNDNEIISINADNKDGKIETNLIESAKSLDNTNIIIQEKEEKINDIDI